MDFESFKNKYQKAPVEYFPHDVPNEPLVSVCVQTYQHADYIEDCLEGILMQETDFSFEILLGEDASNDGTREICIEYAKKYPEKIRLFLHKRANNIHVKGEPTGRFNFLHNLFSSKGKYIALCPGDDYWIDPLKLQKQVEFLEKNQEFGLVFTDVDILNQKKGSFDKSIFKNEINKFPIPSNLEEVILSTGFIAPCTWLFRKELLDFDKSWEVYPDASFALMIEFQATSNIKFLPKTTTVYRNLEESASHSKSIEKNYKREKGIFETQLEYIKKLGLPDDLRKKVLTKHYKIILPAAIALNKKKDIKQASKYIEKEARSFRDNVLLLLADSGIGKYIVKWMYSIKNATS